MNKVEQAIAYHKQGYNCAQSVVCSFCHDMGFDEKTVFQLTEALGRGMGVFGTCGAVSAMAVVIGMKFSDGNLENPKSKFTSYDAMARATEMFTEKNQCTLCYDLRSIATGKPIRSCNDYISSAVEILEKILSE